MSKTNVNELMVKFNIGDNEIKLTPKIVEEYIVGNPNVKISNQEFKLFTELCKVRQLNPFLREAYLIKYNSSSPAQMVVGKDAILKRAILHPKFDGREQGIIVLTKNGEVSERNGTFKLPNEELVGAWARVWRKDWERPTYISVSFDEVAQRKSNGELNHTWATKGATMVEKVALIRALRETFTEELGGMIDEDEVWRNEELQKNTGRAKFERAKAEVVENEVYEDEVIEADYEEVNEDDFNFDDLEA